MASDRLKHKPKLKKQLKQPTADLNGAAWSPQTGPRINKLGAENTASASSPLLSSWSSTPAPSPAPVPASPRPPKRKQRPPQSTTSPKKKTLSQAFDETYSHLDELSIGTQVIRDQIRARPPTQTSKGKGDQPVRRKPLPGLPSSAASFGNRALARAPATGGMSSQRNRGPRGPNRNSEVGIHGEEVQLWQSCQGKIQSVIDSFNESSENVLGIRDQDKLMAEKRENGAVSASDFNQLDNLLRKGVKVNDASGQSILNLIEELKVVRAVVKAKEEQQEQSTSRSSTQRAKESVTSSSVYDFDGVGDSPVPSPNPTVSRRIGGGGSTGSKGDRDSVPPKMDRSTPVAKAGSAEPQGPANIARSKVVFAKDDEVAFKPKPLNNEQTDWILGIVQEVRGEGKSRRYKVLDADLDDAGNQKDFRTSASSMILIPKDGTVLPPLDTGKTVLALYPNTTTFYKAEVMGMGEGKVNLKFEGEESSNTMQAVGRRHVVEYRG